MPLIPLRDSITEDLERMGAARRRLAVQTERNREERFLDYCLKRPECYPTPHEWATWKKMRTLNRFRWYAR